MRMRWLRVMLHPRDSSRWASRCWFPMRFPPCRACKPSESDSTQSGERAARDPGRLPRPADTPWSTHGVALVSILSGVPALACAAVALGLGSAVAAPTFVLALVLLLLVAAITFARLNSRQR